MVAFGPPSGLRARREWWRRQIERHKQSHLSVVQFCARLGVRSKAFYAWRQRLSAASSVSSGASRESAPHLRLNPNSVPTAPFLPVAVRPDTSAGHLEVTLSNSCVLRVTGAVDPDLLRVAIDGAGRLGGKR